MGGNIAERAARLAAALTLFVTAGCSPAQAQPVAEPPAAPAVTAPADLIVPDVAPAATVAPSRPIEATGAVAPVLSNADPAEQDQPAPPAPAPVPAAAPADNPPSEASGPAPAGDEPCDRGQPQVLPAPGSPGAEGFWQTFRTPLPPAPVWNPPGRKRVGLQAGHWLVEQVPPELSRLEGGSFGGGRAEWEVNLDLANRTAELLRAADVEVDVLPSTVPVDYRAHAFLAIHADGDTSGGLRGYKLARAGFSATPDADDRLVAALYDAYGEATGLPRDDAHISRRMTFYYAFNSRRYCHAIAPGTPGAILEAGFLTSAVDRQLLLGNPDLAARGIARGLLRYLGLAD